MRLRDHYDWIVLGDDPGALLSASLAAKLGLSVLILPVAPASNLTILPSDERSDETVLDLESNYVPGLGTGGLWEAALLQAGMTAQEQGQIFSLPASPQILTPTRRVTLERDRKMLEAELEREFGVEPARASGFAMTWEKSDPLIERYWLDLPDRLTLKSSRAESTVRKMPAAITLAKLSDQLARESSHAQPKSPVGDEWQEFAQGMQSAVSGTQDLASCKNGANVAVSRFAALHLMALSRSGAVYRGGMSAFRDYLLKLARRNGADIPPKTECRRIFVQNGRFAGVLPSIRGSMIAGNGGVLGVPLEKVSSMITQSGRAWIRGFKSPKQATGWKFTIALTLHPEAIPPGMARRVIWQERGAPYLEIERVHPTEYGLKDRHRMLLFIRTLLPMNEESLMPSYQRLIAARLLRKATEISPFLEYHIRKIYPDFRLESTREIEDAYGFKSLSDIPSELLCYAGEGVGSQSGVEGLFTCSKESFPDLGLHGSVVSALEGAAWIAHRSGLAGPFLK